MRPSLWTLAAIPLLVVLGLYIYTNQGMLPGVLSPAPAKDTQGTLTCTLTAGKCVHVEETPHYVISATYPNLSGERRRAVEAALLVQINRFKDDLAVMLTSEEKMRLEETGRMYELSIDYKPFEGAGYTSYEFDIYLDTGGAHPNGFYKTLVFDAQGREVWLEDLFKPGARYLEVLSQESYKQVLSELERRSGAPATPDMEETVRLGTAPSPEALQFFVIDGDELVLLFPPYQVAAYALGSFEARIPLANLKDVLK